MRLDLSRGFSLTRAVDLAALLILTLAHFQQDTAEPLEIVWAVLGAMGSVYAAHTCWNRWQIDHWRQQEGYNGLFELTSRQHVVLRFVSFVIELLILISGVVAMLTPASAPQEIHTTDLVITGCVIGIALAATGGCWYAEFIAEAQTAWARGHLDVPVPP